jgi:hypothetical protein
MITLLPNSSTEQFFYLTLQEAKKDFDAFTNYLVEFRSLSSEEEFYFIADVVTDNARYTKISINTDANQPTAGHILLTESGQYSYKVWGQNSTTNLDPTDSRVVAMIERGTLTVTGETGYTIPSISIPDNVIYYQ